MIASRDRSGWIGASDTAIVMGSWRTKSFERWWAMKLGLIPSSDFQSAAMAAGSAYEHPILESIGIRKMDRQIKIPSLKLRVNLDGEDAHTVFEVKTYREEFRLSRAYWGQAQVEMLAADKPCTVVAYKLNPEDYRNYFNPIERKRLSYHDVERDDDWLDHKYLPRLEILAYALKRGEFPNEATCKELEGYAVRR